MARQEEKGRGRLKIEREGVGELERGREERWVGERKGE